MTRKKEKTVSYSQAIIHISMINFYFKGVTGWGDITTKQKCIPSRKS
jgi:hypothetical protein